MDGHAVNRRDDVIRFRLSADNARVVADIALREVGERWISISVAQDRHVTGIGPTARAAVVASLEWLRPATVRELLADLRLLDVSLRVLQVSAG